MKRSKLDVKAYRAYKRQRDAEMRRDPRPDPETYSLHVRRNGRWVDVSEDVDSFFSDDDDDDNLFTW